MSLKVKLDNEGSNWSLMVGVVASSASTPMVVDVWVRVPLSVVPSTMKMGISAMLGVRVNVSAMVVVMTVSPSHTVCFPCKRESGGNYNGGKKSFNLRR